MKKELTKEDLEMIKNLELCPNTRKLEFNIMLNDKDEDKQILMKRLEWYNKQVTEMENLFTENEWNLLIDRSNGEDVIQMVKLSNIPIYQLSDPRSYCSDIMDSIKYKNLGVKWNVRGDDLCVKIQDFSPESIWNLRFLLCYLWDNSQSEFIEQVKIKPEN